VQGLRKSRPVRQSPYVIARSVVRVQQATVVGSAGVESAQDILWKVVECQSVKVQNSWLVKKYLFQNKVRVRKPTEVRSAL
jgi:hypothetical protein